MKRNLLSLVFTQVTNLKSMRYYYFVTSLVLEDAVWSRGNAGRPAGAHKVVIMFMTSYSNIANVQDVFNGTFVVD